MGAAPSPTLPRGAQHAPGARASYPPCRPRRSADLHQPRRLRGPWPCPSTVTCCRGRLPPHTTPGSGDGGGGWSRGSHMRPPGSPASRSRRRGPPRSARIRGSGPAAGANAAPPLRLWLLQETPPFSVARGPRPSSGTPCRRKRLLQRAAATA